MEFVTSDLVRLYIDGRDIRTDLGGIRSTPASTPKKFAEGTTNNSEIPEDMSNLVVEIVENVSDLKDRDDGVKEILLNVVTQAVKEKEGSENVKEVLPDIADGEKLEGNSKNNEVNEIIDGSAKKSESIQETLKVVADTLSGILDSTVDG